ncbi:MAG: hypothetical protein ACREQI_00495 [Candidatus Binataceae bacterium]
MPSRGTKRAARNRGNGHPRARRGSIRQSESVFLNIPYDKGYEKLYVALIAGVCGFRLVPRATIEIPTSDRRLDRIIKLIGSCRFSFHDLSRVELDGSRPRTPRFNMPFELGLTAGLAKSRDKSHRWFVLEEVPHRLTKSLSDLNGTDPQIHRGTPAGILTALTNVLTRNRRSPSAKNLKRLYNALISAADKIKKERGGLFGARAFKELIWAAQSFAAERDRAASR